MQVVESALCSCAVFADTDTLITGSTDYTVRLWKLARGAGGSLRSDPALSVNLTHIMRGHSAPVSCVAASRAWSLVVSGSEDGSASLWDLNRGDYVRSIWHGEGPDHAIHIAAIQESTVRSNRIHFLSPCVDFCLPRDTSQLAHKKSSGYTPSTLVQSPCST